ncbi:hypothetical protein LPB140_06050 [Sphingorhabdus lutea]|uniref:Uncharacterized protein n=2 Tax=Sphingorhabdus lutea TaxID=1913578 RepID=A0A1L3JES4_9SPHN|nr:hypothetical protein LPB140_06050 [Sphingorhabdus lutea]
MKWRIMGAILAVSIFSAPVFARELTGIFGDWGAFDDRDDSGRCFAMAKPAKTNAPGDNGAFFSVGFWPKDRVYHQIQVRFSRERSTNAGVILSAGGRSFRLTAGRLNGWAKDRKMDIAIISAMRSANSISVEAVGRDGRPIVDVYRVKGSASAIDSALLACRD